ncbi:MAG: hypothetical protein OCC46_12210 [Pseudodesulfovibrio sp.]
MISRTSKFFWGSWPLESQTQFFKFVLLGLLALAFSVAVGLKLFAGSMDQRIAHSKEQYGRVVPIVQDIKALRAQQGNLVHLPVDEAVWSIIDDLLMEENLTSIHSTRINEDLEGVQVTFIGLSLTKLTNFLNAMRDQASLQTPSCAITRNADDPRLADAHFVLAR